MATATASASSSSLNGLTARDGEAQNNWSLADNWHKFAQICLLLQIFFENYVLYNPDLTLENMLHIFDIF